MSEEVGLRLAELASEVLSDQAIVEIGSYKGKSTCYLAAGSQAGAGAEVWAIDPWDLPGNPAGKHGFTSAREVFDRQRALMGFRGVITAVQGFSADVARIWREGKVGLLFIDGSHLYEDVRDDWRAWRPHLARGAVVAFDDFDTPRNPGVKRFIEEMFLQDELSEWEFQPPPLAIARYQG